MDNLTQQARNMGISAEPASAGSINTTLDSKKRFNAASSQSFLPTTSSSKTFKGLRSGGTGKFSGMLSPNLSDIPSFIPSDDAKPLGNPFNANTPSFEPPSNPMATTSPTLQNPYLVPNDTSQMNPYAQHQSIEHLPIMNNFNSIGSAQQDFMYPMQPQSNYPLNYHLYSQPQQRLHLHMRGNEQNCESLFIPDKLREALTKKNELTLKTMAQSNLPSSAGVYFDLVPLSMNPDRTKRSYGYHNSLYKATSNTNGRAYALRRIEDVRIEKDRSISTIHNWIKLRHSNVAQAVDAFTTIAFGDNSLLVVYDYYPDAKSLYEQHIFSNLGKPEPITMEILWTYMCQIAAGIAAVHSRKMVVRSLSLKKIIVTSKNRIRLSDCGVFDILEYSEMLDAYELIQLQEKDLIQFGETMFELAQKFVSKDKLRQYTEEDVLSHPDLDPAFQKALKYLRDTDHAQSIEELQQLICQRLFKELDRLEHSADFYENQLMRELENARIVRLMSKINFIIDRPEYEQNKHWLPTGDRHPIKLFHQHVFNQVDSNGKPVLDLAHVLINLNKLDAGIEERIMLVSPDETECLIVSYKEIKDLIEKSFRELTKDMSV